jgi:uncharacterized membrane protein (UPF0127 family)
MLLMRFPIDAVFLDRRGRVVRAAERLRPWTPMIAARGAIEVVELRAGAIAESGTQAGDDLMFDEAGVDGASR